MVILAVMWLLLALVVIVVFGGYIAWRYLGQPLSAQETEQLESEVTRHHADVTIIDSAMSNSQDR